MPNDEKNNSVLEEFRKGKREVEEEIEKMKQEQSGSASIDNSILTKLSENAKSDKVTPDRLAGNEQYFYGIVPFLEDGEQPHYLFPLTKGLLAEPALVVESGAEREELLTKSDGGTVAVTDRYVRIHSSKGEWTIPYTSVVSVDFVGHPALHIQTAGRTYYINIAGTHFDLESSLSNAAKYIRKKERAGEASRSAEPTSEDPIEKIERLSELHEKGILSEEEFKKKKSSLLDEI